MYSFFYLVLFALALPGSYGFSSGAPTQACAAVSPDPSQHGAQPRTTTNPYTLSVSGLPSTYTPGQSYSLTINGGNFKGFLAVSLNTGGARVGSFTPPAGARTACSDNRGITHNSAVDKSSITFTWIAPGAGTGAVTFRFAVVQVRATYWANQLGPVLQEAQPQPDPTSTSSDTVAPSTSSDDIASSTSDTIAPSTSSDTASPPSTSSAADGGTSSTASSSPSSTATPGEGGNSAPSNVAGSLATILLAVAALVMVAVFV